MIYFKSYDTDKGLIIAMCDEELIGKVLKEGKRELDLSRYGDFYKDELLAELDAKARIKAEDIYSANIVGKRSVAIFIEKELATQESVMTIAKVPFIQLFKMV